MGLCIGLIDFVWYHTIQSVVMVLIQLGKGNKWGNKWIVSKYFHTMTISASAAPSFHENHHCNTRSALLPSSSHIWNYATLPAPICCLTIQHCFCFLPCLFLTWWPSWWDMRSRGIARIRGSCAPSDLSHPSQLNCYFSLLHDVMVLFRE